MIYRLNPRSSFGIEKMKTVLREKIIHKGIEMILFHKFQGGGEMQNKWKPKGRKFYSFSGICKRFEVLRDIACFWMKGHMEM